MAEAVVNNVVEQLISDAFSGALSGAFSWVKDETSLLKEVETELNNMKKKMLHIQTVLEDAQNQSVKKPIVKTWLEDLQDVSYDMEDVLDEWKTRAQTLKREVDEEDEESAEDNTSTKIVGSKKRKRWSSMLPNWLKSVKQLPWRRDIALRIKDINERMNSVFSDMEKFNLASKAVANDDGFNHNNISRITTSFVDETKVYGREEDETSLLNKVLSVNITEEKSFQVVSIVGVGGLGKTTLAQLAYNNEKVKEKFATRIWVCVSNPFDEVKVARAILEQLHVDHTKMENLETLLRSIECLIVKNKFLLVLDDVWEEDSEKWKNLSLCLKGGDPGSIILVTTRKQEVVTAMSTMGTSQSNILKPGLISDLDCWLLMKQRAFQGRTNMCNDELEGTGREIAKKCKGLPLAAKTIGGLLMSKDSAEEWEKVLKSEIWELEEVKVDLFPHIFLSYQELPSMLKRCFLILALFPKGYNLHVEEMVIPLWMAHGYLNRRMEHDDMVKFLVSRAFLEEDEYVVTMHDIMHDFALHLLGDEVLSISGSTSKRAPNPTKVRHIIIVGNINPTLIEFDLGKVRTCIINEVPPNVTSNLVKQLKRVRFLDLEDCDLERTPESIVNLIHMRVLNLCGNPLDELPERIGDLFNLQQLWLERIDTLSTIPPSLGKLINLTLLRPNDLAIEKVPESVGKLINIQGLDVVEIEAGKSNLGFLKDLNQLRDLEIEFKSEYGDEVDAKKAAIGSKKHLTRLDITAYNHRVTDGVLAALQPHPSLQTLQISGNVLPSWITSLQHLKDITLRWGDATTFPPLWKLRSLEKIHIHEFNSLKTIGTEFLGINNSSNKNVCAFPKLVELKFFGCSELKGFEDLKAEEFGEITVIPNLQTLSFSGCDKFVEIPFRLLRQASCLKWFSSTRCFFISVEDVVGDIYLYSKDNCLLMRVKGSRSVSISTIAQSYITVLDLYYQTRPISELPPMGKLPHLQSLTIGNLSSLKFIGRDFLGIDNQESVAFTYLVNLEIEYCDLLEGWEDLKPEDEGKIIVMPKLEKLKIRKCPKFRVMPSRLLLKLSSSLKVLHLPHHPYEDDKKLENRGVMGMLLRDALLLQICRIVILSFKKSLRYWLTMMEVSDRVQPPMTIGNHASNESSRVIDIAEPSQLKTLRLLDPLTPSKVVRLLYTNSGLALLALASNAVHKLWKWQSGKSTASIAPQLWQPPNGALMSNDISDSKPAEESSACIALSKNDSYLISASGGKVSLFNRMTFKVMTTFMPPPPAATYLAFLPHDNNIIAVGMEDSTIRIYNVRVDWLKTKLEGHQKRITGLAFSKNLLVSSGADAQLCIWSIGNWKKKKMRPIQAPPGDPLPLVGDTSVQFHNDQSHVLVVHESQIAIYHTRLGWSRSWHPKESLSAAISSAIYSCDGMMVVTGFCDEEIGIFDAYSLRLRCRIAPSAYIPSSLASGNGSFPVVIAAHPSDPNQFALGMRDGAVYVVELSDGETKWAGTDVQPSSSAYSRMLQQRWLRSTAKLPLGRMRKEL